jgi:hypothetical protein
MPRCVVVQGVIVWPRCDEACVLENFWGSTIQHNVSRRFLDSSGGFTFFPADSSVPPSQRSAVISVVIVQDVNQPVCAFDGWASEAQRIARLPPPEGLGIEPLDYDFRCAAAALHRWVPNLLIVSSGGDAACSTVVVDVVVVVVDDGDVACFVQTVRRAG